MTKEELTLLAAVIAALTSIFSLVLGSSLTFSREKKKLVWEMQIERIQDLEDQVGIAQEIVMKHRSTQQIKEEYLQISEELKLLPGRFARYPHLAKSLRVFAHCCDLLLDDRLRGNDYRESLSDIPKAYQDVIFQCDQVLKRVK
ncbi:hypothetical protein [Photobacterium damselae]|uniref:hypothetical protein n=1 Tax=Photobacterium damselae TaxID=38293 RepID=UPI0015A1BFDA|nr:hypothetical protein [Photobacterium damselae]NVO61454.1 hypothetical protein [Photobacterium damselae subsp. damselae]